MKNYKLQSTILRVFSKWKNLKPVPFIISTNIAAIVFTIPVALILEVLEITDEQIGGIDPEKYNSAFFIFFVIIIAPLIETFLGQVLPIKLSQKLFKKIEVPIFISTVIFAALHYTYSLWYSLLVLPLSYFLAHTYIVFQDRKESAFFMTFFVHAFRNFIVVALLDLTQ